MLRNLFALLFIGVAFSPTLFSQDFDNYRPMQCQGEIPAELLVESSEKFEQEKEELATTGSNRERKSKENFLLQSNFVMDDLLLSGRVLFNDPISEYVTRVKDYLLRDKPDIAEKMRVYVVKSPSVNAFCTNNGIILVNMGLIAQLPAGSIKENRQVAIEAASS